MELYFEIDLITPLRVSHERPNASAITETKTKTETESVRGFCKRPLYSQESLQKYLADIWLPTCDVTGF